MPQGCSSPDALPSWSGRRRSQVCRKSRLAQQPTVEHQGPQQVGNWAQALQQRPRGLSLT